MWPTRFRWGATTASLQAVRSLSCKGERGTHRIRAEPICQELTWTSRISLKQDTIYLAHRDSDMNDSLHNCIHRHTTVLLLWCNATLLGIPGHRLAGTWLIHMQEGLGMASHLALGNHAGFLLATWKFAGALAALCSLELSAVSSELLPSRDAGKLEGSQRVVALLGSS